MTTTIASRARIALIALGVAAILFLFVFPTRAYLAQRRQVSVARHDVDVLRKQNEQLETEAERLQTPDEIKRLAREYFNMVYPGEQPYKVLPSPSETPTTAP
jgi:cell division protein FtsB